MTDDETKDVRCGKPSASGLERLVLCPGSWQAEAKCPEEPESADAAMGTRLHKHMEDGSEPVDAGEAEACFWCRETAVLLCDQVGINTGGESFIARREVRLWDKDGSFSGQADVMFFEGDKVLILDYKFGRNPVTRPVQNMQLAALALLVADNFPEVEMFYAGILQPYVSREIPDVVMMHREGMEGVRSYIRAALAKAQGENPPLCAGEKQCRYCRAAAGCPALSLTMQKGALTDFQRWTMLTPEQRRQAYDWAKAAKRAAAKIEEAIRADLADDMEIPGLELTDGRAGFKVTDPGQAFSVLSSCLDVSALEFSACCSVTITPLDKLVHGKLKAVNPKQTVMTSRAWLREKLSGCGEVKVSEGSIKERR